MKQLLQYILLLVFIFISFKCKTNPIDPSSEELNHSDSNKYYSVSGVVFDVIYENRSPDVIKGVSIVIGEDTAISDFEGKFHFDKVLEGNHIISVTLPNYENYLNTISIPQDTNITIRIYGIKEDYFPPIQLNSQIKFEYLYANFTVLNKGEAIWNCLSLKMSGDSLIYNIQETLIYTQTVGGGNPQLNTLIKSFEIIEDKSHKVTLNQYGFSFNRFIDPRQGEIVYFSEFIKNPIFSLELKKNVGLYSFGLDSPGYWREYYRRIE